MARAWLPEGAWRARLKGAGCDGAGRSAKGRGKVRGAMRTRAGPVAVGRRLAASRLRGTQVPRWKCQRRAGAAWAELPGCGGWEWSPSVGRDEDVGGAATAEAGSAAGAVVSPRSEVRPVRRPLREKRRSESSRAKILLLSPQAGGTASRLCGFKPRVQVARCSPLWRPPARPDFGVLSRCSH